MAGAAKTLRVYQLAVDGWLEGHPDDAAAFDSFITASRELSSEGAGVSVPILLSIVKQEFPTFPDIKAGAFAKWLRREEGREG